MDVGVSLPDWVHTVPEIIRRSNLRLCIETPQSAKALYEDYGHFCEDTHIGNDLEMMIVEAFVDEIYEDDMHCITIRDLKTNHPAGIIFWRDIEYDEMKAWVTAEGVKSFVKRKRKRIVSPTARQESALLLDNTQTIDRMDVVCADTTDLYDQTDTESKIPPSSGEMVEKLDRFPSIDTRTATHNPSQQIGSTSKRRAGGDKASSSSAIIRLSKHRPDIYDPVNSDFEIADQQYQQVFKDWIKLELVCTSPQFYGRRIGTMLMAACLAYAATHRKKHGILHVAGGKENVPAMKLYRRFGFKVPPKDAFDIPNKNLLVLPNIFHSLSSINWKDLLTSLMAQKDSKHIQGPESLQRIEYHDSSHSVPQQIADTGDATDTTNIQHLPNGQNVNGTALIDTPSDDVVLEEQIHNLSI